MLPVNNDLQRKYEYDYLLHYLNLCQEVFLEKSVKTCIYYSYNQWVKWY